MRITSCNRRGFTLIEVLVSVVIIALLIGLSFAGLKAALESGQRASALANLRSIGQGISSYTLDNQDQLPGPLWPGQMPMLDPNREGRLVRELAPYLGIPMPDTPTLVDLFVPPAYRSHSSAPDLENARTFVLNMEVVVDGESFNPWGALTDEEPQSPRRMVNVPQDVWALSDADQLHPRVRSAPWRINTPSEIIHGKKRLALYFGGHVGPIDESDLVAGNTESENTTSPSDFREATNQMVGPSLGDFNVVGEYD